MRRAEVAQGAIPEPGEPVLGDVAALLSEGLARVVAGRIIWANDSLATVCGRPSTEALLGLRLEELLVDAGSGLPDPAMEVPIECWVRDLAQRRVRLSHGASTGADGELWLVEDVSHLARLEAEALEQAERLRAANAKCASLQRRLDAEHADREELLCVVSHELRTPITVISGYSRLLLEEEAGPLNEEQRRFLKESRASCKRLDEFVTRLLAATPSEIEPSKLVAQPIVPTLEGVAAFLRPVLLENEASLQLDLSPDVEWAVFDPHQIEQVVTNLIGNAVKYTKSGGAIRLQSRLVSAAGQRQIEIAVLDEGPGVPAQDRERIFQPYVRGAADTGLNGLGLGLAICRRIVEAHGGSIVVRDREGGGSCFAFSLPVASSAVGSASEEV